MPDVKLRSGTIHYEKTGPDGGRPVVFVHGYMMGGSLWRPLAERLARAGLCCVAPTWPLGAHPEPMREGAELTMESIAAMIAEFLDALDLRDVVLVGNDTGGALAQIVATTAPQRLGALVLTGCDAFEHFPPPILKPLIAAAKFPPAFALIGQTMRTRAARQRAFGGLAHADIDPLVVEWVRPGLHDRRVARDLRRFTASLNQRSTLEAAARLPAFDRPALIAWSADDEFFAAEDGIRLAETLPAARLEVIAEAKTFSMIDQTEVLAGLITEFAGQADRAAA